MDEWLIIYRGYSATKLAEEIEWLTAQSRNPFSAQSQGTRSFQRSPSDIRVRLSAATQVSNERSGAGVNHNAVADFSGVQP